MFSRVPPPKSVDHQSNLTDSDSETTTTHGILSSTGTAMSPDSDSGKPKHVPSHLWEKFKALEKRTDDVTRHSTERRMKHLKRQIVETVKEEITHPDDVDILRAHDVKLGSPVEEPTTKKKGKHKKAQDSETVDTLSNRNSPGNPNIGEWVSVKRYLDVNKHLELGASKGHSKLELDMEDAVMKGDYSRADRLSDELANREFGTKIAGAFDARDFVKRKKEEEAAATAKKKKKLNWGFDHKQPWEMKSNM